MAIRTYTLKIRIENSQAVGEASKLAATLGKLEGVAEKAADRVEKAGTKAAASATTAAKAAVQGAKASADATEQSSAKSEKARDREVARGMVGLNTLRVQAVKLGDRLAAEAEKASEKSAKAREKEVTRGMVGLDQLRMAAIKFGDKQEEIAEAGVESSKRQAGGVAEIAKQYLGVAKAAAALKLVLDGMKYGSDLREGTADAALDLHKQLREDSALAGYDKSDSRMAGVHLNLRATTTLDKDDASKFYRQFKGSLPIGVQKGNIDAATADAFMEEAGLRAARLGGDASTHGDLAGILPQFKRYDKGKAGVRQLLGDAESVRIGLTEGRGDDGPLTRQLLKVAGATVAEGGSVPDMPELAALIGVTSLSAGPEAAGTRAEQLMRGLRVGLSRHGKAKGTDEAQGAYLKRLGIGENDKLISGGAPGEAPGMMDKMADDLKKAEAGGRNLDVYLADHNFRSMQERKAIIETYRNLDAWRQRVQTARQPGRGAEQLAANRKYLDSPEGQHARGQAMRDAAGYAKGQEALNSQALRPGEEAAQLENEGGTGQYARDSFRGFLTVNPLSLDYAAQGRKRRYEHAMAEKLEEQARKLGATDDEIATAYNRHLGVDMQRPEFTADALSKLIRQKGGNPGAGANQDAESRVWGKIQEAQPAAVPDIEARRATEAAKARAMLAPQAGGGSALDRLKRDDWAQPAADPQAMRDATSPMPGPGRPGSDPEMARQTELLGRLVAAAEKPAPARPLPLAFNGAVGMLRG